MPELKIRATQRSVCVSCTPMTREGAEKPPCRVSKQVQKRFFARDPPRRVRNTSALAISKQVQTLCPWSGSFLQRSELPHVTETVLICSDDQSGVGEDIGHRGDRLGELCKRIDGHVQK